MKKFGPQIFIVLLLTVSVTAQTQARKPEIFDRFGSISLEDLLGRLDNFIFHSAKTPNAKGLIRIYGSNENCFLCRYNSGSLIEAYLKNTKKIPSEKYSIEYCDESAESLRTELHILPATAGLPKCAETWEAPKNTAIFGTAYFYYKNNKLNPIEAAQIEIGPSEGEYSVNVLKKVKNILGRSPGSKIYVIAYLGTNSGYQLQVQNGETIAKTTRDSDKKSLAGKMLLNAKNEFIKNGIKPAQIETIDGGYVDGERKLEFWFVPKGGRIPEPQPDYFPKKN